jgi:hypothetical protein
MESVHTTLDHLLASFTLKIFIFPSVSRAVRDVGGVVKLVKIAKGNYNPKVMKTANQVK